MLYARIASGFGRAAPTSCSQPDWCNATFLKPISCGGITQTGGEVHVPRKRPPLDIPCSTSNGRNSAQVNNGGVNQLENAGTRGCGARSSRSTTMRTGADSGGSMAYPDARLTTAAP